MTDVFLYQGEANPNDVKLRDPTTGGGAASLTASIAVLLDDITSSFAAALGHSASLSATLDGITVAFTGATGHPATEESTLDDVSVSLAVEVGHPASLLAVLDDVAVSASAEVAGSSTSITAELSVELDGVSVQIESSSGFAKVGGDDAFHPGWNKEAWQARQKREDAIADTIAEAYNRILGIEPEPEVVAEIATVVAEKAPPVADYSGVSEWLQAQERIVADLIAQRAEEDDEETILMLIG